MPGEAGGRDRSELRPKITMIIIRILCTYIYIYIYIYMANLRCHIREAIRWTPFPAQAFFAGVGKGRAPWGAFMSGLALWTADVVTSPD